MNREFTRKEIYDLVWSRPIRDVAVEIGISDVALAKQCKRANVPVPGRGYWAQRQAGKPTIQIDLPPRMPGSSDRIGGNSSAYFGYGHDWVEEYLKMAVPEVPTFDEELPSVEIRTRKLVGKVRFSKNFETTHPLVARFLAHDDAAREETKRNGWSFDKPKYDVGIERRRLLLLNPIFLALSRLGCRISMSTSKYQDRERDIHISMGGSTLMFNVEAVDPRNEKSERLKIALGSARDRKDAEKCWEDTGSIRLENSLSDIVVALLMEGETAYRQILVERRDWIIKRKADAEIELLRLKEEERRKKRDQQEKLARERVGRLLSQAKAFRRATEIRNYVEAILSSPESAQGVNPDVGGWVEWARKEADQIDPVKNGVFAASIAESKTQ